MPKGIDGRLLRRRAPPLLACLLAALATVAVAAGCGNSSKSDAASSTVASSARKVVQVQHVKQDRWTYARARFNELCAGCHTLRDAGARGRRYNLDHAGALSETRIRYTIADGEPGMPAWRDVLSGREYEELVAYILAVRGNTPGNDRWHEQLMLRMEGSTWSKDKTARLEAYARRLDRMR
ncbi:MAG: c-type cytochrome [Conexibacter sp.]